VLTHDVVVARLRALGEALDAAPVVAAFVDSLGTAPGYWRSPLGALAAARAVPEHAHRAPGPAAAWCAECGLTPKVPLRPLHPRGQLLPGDLAAALAVLEQVPHETPPPVDPEGPGRLTRMFALVGSLPPATRESRLTAAVRAAGLVVGDRYDVGAVVETLGVCGVLDTPEHPGLARRWTSYARRQDRPADVEVDPPLAFWTAAHGVSSEQVAAWFGELGVRVPVEALPRMEAVAVASARADARAAAEARRAARSTELEIGDAVALRVDGVWYAAVVVDHFRDRGGRRPVLEVLDWYGAGAPRLDELSGARAAGTVWGQGRSPCRVAIDLWAADDRAGRWRRVGRGLPAPDRGHLTGELRLPFVRVGRDGAGLAWLVRDVGAGAS